MSTDNKHSDTTDSALQSEFYQTLIGNNAAVTIPFPLSAPRARVWSELAACTIQVSKLAYSALDVSGTGADAQAAQAQIDAMREDIKMRSSKSYDAVFTHHDLNNNNELEMSELEVVLAEFMVVQTALLPKLVECVRSGILTTVAKALVAESPALGAEPIKLSEVMAAQEPEIDASVFGMASGLSVRLKEVWEHPRKYSRLLFTQLDSNSDGRITREEFLANSKYLEDLAQPDPNGMDGKDPAEAPLEAFLSKPIATGAAQGVSETAAALGSKIRVDALLPKPADAAASAPAVAAATEPAPAAALVPQSSGPRASVSVVAAALAAADAKVAEEAAAAAAAEEKRRAQRAADAAAALGPQPAIDLNMIAAAKLKNAESGEEKSVVPRESVASLTSTTSDQSSQPVVITTAQRPSVLLAAAAAPTGERRASQQLPGPATAGGAANTTTTAPRGSVSAGKAAGAAPGESAVIDKRPSVLSRIGTITGGQSDDAAAGGENKSFAARAASRASISARAPLPSPSPAAQAKQAEWDARVNANNDAIAKMMAALEERNRNGGYVTGGTGTAPLQQQPQYAQQPGGMVLRSGQASNDFRTANDMQYDKSEVAAANTVSTAAVCTIM